MCVKSWRNSALFELTNFNFGAQLAGKWHYFAHKPRSNSTDHAHTLFLVAAKVVKILEIAHTHTHTLSLALAKYWYPYNGQKRKQTKKNLRKFRLRRAACVLLLGMDGRKFEETDRKPRKRVPVLNRELRAREPQKLRWNKSSNWYCCALESVGYACARSFSDFCCARRF